jgi:replication factor C subunit 1
MHICTHVDSSWAAAAAAKSRGPAAPGSKAVPEPKSADCLAGLTFVFTGELTSFSRDEATDLAKRFGGRITGQPSSKTSYIVLGENAGPSKLAAIKKNGLKTLNEDEFLDLIATRVGPSGPGGQGDEKMRKKAEKEQQAIEKAAKVMEENERQMQKEQTKKAKAAKKAGVVTGKKEVDVSTQLWTDRYAPTNLRELCGNKSSVDKLQKWLEEW